MVERVRITPTNMTLRSPGGGVVFSTDYRYIKSDPGGNMRLTPIAPTPINYVTETYTPAPGGDVIIESHSGINILAVASSPSTSLSIAGPAFPADGNLIFGPNSRFAYILGSGLGPAFLYDVNNPSYSPLFANVYSGSRYVGTLRLQAWRIMSPQSGNFEQQIGIAFNAYMRTSEAALGTNGITHSVPVYRGEKLTLLRSGPISGLDSATIASPIRLDFNSGTSTIALKVTA